MLRWSQELENREKQKDIEQKGVQAYDGRFGKVFNGEKDCAKNCFWSVAGLILPFAPLTDQGLHNI